MTANCWPGSSDGSKNAPETPGAASGAPALQITILGSGTCVPSLKRSACAVLVNVQDTTLLLDAGAGTMHRLLEANTRIFDIDYILLSHFHPDHSGELVPFLFATKYPDGRRRRKPLTLIAGRGLNDFFHRLRAVYGTWIDLAPGLMQMVEMRAKGYQKQRCDNFTVAAIPVQHNPESVAYRITAADGKSVVYSGDTDHSDNLIALAAHADVLICEAALPDGQKVAGHLTPSLAGEIARQAQVRRLVLTHFYPQCDGVDIARECRKTYSGPLTLAEDLLQIPI